MDQTSSPNLHSSNDVDWRTCYIDQLQMQLVRAVEYIKSAPPADIQRHGQSLLALLREAHHYAGLKPGLLRLIKRLNPQPIRWGWGSRWAAELEFILENLETDDVNLQAQYRCDLADIYLPAGRFEDAIRQAEIVLELEGVKPSHAALAARLLFTSYRSTGQHSRADDLMQTVGTRFGADKSAAEVPAPQAQSWLIYHQSMLELLRE